jgi:cytochrome c oxidase cbb3-type subunit 1
MADHPVQNDNDVINRELIKGWLLWGFVWVLLAPTLGVIISTKFTYPEFLDGVPALTFGRLRPIHVNGVIFGTFSTLFLGLCYYIVPKLAQVRIYKEEWGYPMLWIWNLALIAGFASLAMGYNQGLEAAEFPLLIDIIIWIALLGVTVQLLVTVARRKEPGLYVSLWYLVAALVWMDINWPFGNFIIPYAIPGINNAALHGLYIHYIVGLWITPAGYVLIYYFLPASVRNPLYSHKLSLIGFWSLALFYPFVGIHHYLFSPIADWAETISIMMSVLLILPVWTVLQNFFGTMMGRWQGFAGNLTAKFLITGALMYLIGCFQGSTEALQALQRPTHFTDFVIAHSHLTIFGTFVLWALAGVVYVWPRVSGRELYSFRMANWGYWLITMGISTMGVILTAQGLQQGFMLIAGAEWLDSLVSMHPFWWFRTFSGISMDVGMSLLLLSLLWGPKSRAAEPSLARTAQIAPVAS